MRTEHDPQQSTRSRDEGVVLVLTLLLTIVLATVVLALATYAATGVTTSRVTTARTESNASAASTMNWAIEEFAKKQFVPEDPTVCAAAAVPIAVPGGLVTDGSVELTCQTQPLSPGNNPQVVLVADATTTGGSRRSIEVLLEVPALQYTTQVNSWVVD